MIEIPGRLHSKATDHVVAGANEILDDELQKKLSEINAENESFKEAQAELNEAQSDFNSEVREALGTGGTVDERIVNAVNTEKARAEAAESALDGRVDTLEEAVGNGGSVDSRIAAAVASEASRAQTAEEQLRQAYEALSQSQPIPVTELPATGEAGKIYRLAGTNSYADYMYAEGSLTTPIKMAEYNNAIDDEPTAGSDNLVKSGGVASQISQLDQDIRKIDGEPIDIDISNLEVHNGTLDGNNWWIHPYYEHVVLSVKEGQEYKIIANPSEGCSYAQLADYNCIDGQPTTAIVQNSADAGKTVQFSIVTGAHYLVIFVKYNNVNITPSSVSQTFYGGLLNQLDDKINQELGEIRIDIEKGILNQEGNIGGDDLQKHSDFIEVSPGENFYCKATETSISWNTISYYDSTKQYIKALSYNQSVDGVFIVPSGVSYMRISGRVANPLKCVIYRYVKNDRLVYSIPPSIKYPKLVTDRGCLSFQMDLSHDANTLSDPTYKDMLSVLRSYGIMKMDFGLMPFQVNHSVYNIGANTNIDLEWLRKVQSEGCEIIFHSDSNIGNNTDISDDSTLTIAEAKAGLNNDLNIIKNGGFVSYGLIAQDGEIKSDFLPFINKQFLWTTYGNSRIQEYYYWLTYKSHYLDEENEEYHRICRTAFELDVTTASASDIEYMIQQGKLFIDTICTNKCMGTIYCHSYNTPTGSTLPHEVLIALCAYIKEKIADGVLVVGTTTECLNYLCSK